jgi:hypothetical protein
MSGTLHRLRLSLIWIQYMCVFFLLEHLTEPCLTTKALQTSVSKAQYDGLLALLQSNLISVEKLKNASLRSKCGEGNNATVLWRFALAAVLSDVREKARTFSWEAIQTRINYRREYIQLFKRISVDESLEKEFGPRLTELERAFALPDLLVFRKVALKLAEDIKNKNREDSNQKPGFFARLFSSQASKKKVQADQAAEPQTDAALALKEVYAAFGYQDIMPQKYPTDYVLVRLKFNLPNAVVSLKDSMDDTSTFAQIDFEASTATFSLRAGLSWLLEFGLKDLLVFDCASTAGIRFPILRKKDDGVSLSRHLLSGSIEYQPPVADSSKDLELLARVRAILLPTNLTASVPFLRRVQSFFSRESSDADFALQRVLQAAQLVAAASGKEIKQKIKDWTSSFLKANSKKRFVDIEVTLHGPTLHLSSSFGDASAPVLLVDLGRATVSTDHTKLSLESLEASSPADFEVNFTVDEVGAILVSDRKWSVLEPTKVIGAVVLSSAFSEMGTPKVKASLKSPSVCLHVSRRRLAIISEILRPLVEQFLVDQENPLPIEPASTGAADAVLLSLERTMSLRNSSILAEAFLFIENIKIIVLEDIGGQESALVTLGLENMSLTASLGSGELVSEFFLQRLYIQDSFLERRLALKQTCYLLNCGSRVDARVPFVQMKFRIALRPADETESDTSTDMFGEIHVGEIDLSICRPTLAAFSVFLSSTVESLQKILPGSKGQHISRTQPIRSAAPVVLSRKGRIFAIRFTFDSCRVALKHGASEFLEAKFEKMEGSLDLSASLQLLFAGSLGNIVARHFSSDQIVEIIQSPRQSSYASFLFEYWIERGVPDYDMFLSVTATSTKFVVPIPLLIELQAYFSVMSGIYGKFKSLQSGIDPQESTFLYRFEAHKSVFVVPRGSSEDAVLMKIGTFEVFNKLEAGRDVLSIAAAGLACSPQSKVDGKLTRHPSVIKNFAISVKYVPQDGADLNRVTATIPKLNLDLQTEQLMFVWDVILDNVSQQIEADSTDENSLISALLAEAAQEPPIQTPWTGVVDVKMEEANLTLMKVENRSRQSFLHLAVTQLASSVTMQNDGIRVAASLKNAAAVDLRKETPDFKCIMFKSGVRENGQMITLTLYKPSGPSAPELDISAGDATVFLSPSHVECMVHFLMPLVKRFEQDPDPVERSLPELVVSSCVDNMEFVLFSGSNTSRHVIQALLGRFVLKGRVGTQGALHASAHQFCLKKGEAGDVGLVHEVTRLIEPSAIHIHAQQSGQQWKVSGGIDHFFAIVSLQDISAVLFMATELAESTAGLRALWKTEAAELDSKRAARPALVPSADYQIQLQFSDIVLGLLDDSIPGVESPMLRARASTLQADARIGATSSVSISLQEFILDAFNSDLSGYDVVIEPWAADVHIASSPLNIVGVSRSRLCVNISKSLIDNAIKLHSVVFSSKQPMRNPLQSSLLDSSLSLSAISRQLTSPFMVKNEYEASLKVALSGFQESEIELAPQALAALNPVESGRMFTLQHSVNRYMDVKIFSAETQAPAIEKVPISSVGVFSFLLPGPRPDRIIVDISRSGGSNLITIRPPFSVSNGSNLELQLEFERGAARAQARVTPQSTSRLASAFATWDAIKIQPLVSSSLSLTTTAADILFSLCRVNKNGHHV